MPELSQAELASRYGLAMAVINSHPDLKRIFSKAVAQTWTPERFVAELRNTSWYKKHGESWRNAVIQKNSDPATYKANVDQVRTRVSMMASELGAVATSSTLAKMAENAYMFGWDDNQLRQNLSTYVKYTDGRMIGQAGQWEQELRQRAADQGVRLSDDWVRNQVKLSVGGKKTFEDAIRGVDEMAASAFPHLADRIRAGDTLADIADPYKQTMAQLLELNAESINLRDPMLRGALAKKDAKGQTVMATLYDFEQEVRNDKRWLKTNNAQDAAMATTNRVLKDMGLIS